MARPTRTLTALLLAIAIPALAAHGALGLVPDPLAENPWLERRVLNMAHQGGALEAPSNTLYAFHYALSVGAHVLELDVHATADGEIVVLHDSTVDRTTNGAGRVDAMTLAEIKTLDAAYWWVQGHVTTRSAAEEAYILRGMATGDKAPPGGFEANDFTIPTLREVLERFPDVLINIEIKATAPDTKPYEATLAALLAEFGRGDDVIVVSFLDQATEAFRLFAPHVSTATGTGQAAVFWTTAQGPAPGSPHPWHHALQVPVDYLGLNVVNADFVARAHANGLAVHVWTIDDRATMEWLLDLGVDGIMTDRPALLHEVLVDRGLA